MSTTKLSLGFLLALSFVAFPALAFNKERCGTLFPKSDSTHPPYYSPLYISTMVPSTSSYFSSIGPCSMYGTENPNARRSFVEESVVQIQSDAARGGGDYLNALAELSGCPETEFKTFARTVHKQYSELFPAPDATEFMGKIDSRVKSHAVLKRNCTGLGQGLTSKTPSSELTKNL